MKAAYPVIFTQTEENVLVEVPDLDILTEGMIWWMQLIWRGMQLGFTELH